MNEILLSITPYAGVALAAVATLATMLAIGIGFLSHPGRATLDWSFAFALVMVAAYGAVVAAELDSDLLRHLSLGGAVAAPVLIWSGVRALRGVRDLPWVGGAFAVIAAGVLGLAAGTPWDALAHRGTSLVGAVFAALLVLEWWRLPRPRSACLIPLVTASALLALTAIAATIVDPAVTSAAMSEDLVGLVGVAAAILYLLCALVAAIAPPVHALLAARRSGASVEWQAFERAAAHTCRQAQATGEPCSLVHIQLDDASEIHDTAGRGALAELNRRVDTEIRAALPPGTVIGQPSVGRFVVLIRRPDADIRDLVRDALRRISRIELEGSHLQPSASAGWAQTSTVGYELGALAYMARDAAALASEKGGDRWERVGSTVIDRLLSAPALR
ncbi:hypothetical protein ASD65_15540 [Microbacterium sp. Root61]|uniref:GGDEF domain-containing protein n=1 Tax=Microbacterium sp. Root61 TaxID=1736570 RepID=UPI0006F203C3|nr:diguanylate cyclase [Microbacterium sp. Root61]KRA25675.1 hypothetical protein ASD65_15540 [Microbacterium sp. Root61]